MTCFHQAKLVEVRFANFMHSRESMVEEERKNWNESANEGCSCSNAKKDLKYNKSIWKLCFHACSCLFQPNVNLGVCVLERKGFLSG